MELIKQFGDRTAMKIVIISLLVLSMYLLPVRGLAQQSSNAPVATQAQSLGDIARKNQADKAAAAKANPVSVPVHELQGNSLQQEISIPKTEESVSSALEQFRHIGKDELGTAILKIANANVDFPNRRDWEQSLFEAKKEWQDQVDRMMAHKDSNQSVKNSEIGLTRKAQLNFESIRRDGIEQARAVNDPVLRAHLRYEDWARLCISQPGLSLGIRPFAGMTGSDMKAQCWAALENFKNQMQEEGTW
jgi:hypothetical protein